MWPPRKRCRSQLAAPAAPQSCGEGDGWGLPDQRYCGQLAAPTFQNTPDVGRSDVGLPDVDFPGVDFSGAESPLERFPGADSSGARVSDVGRPAGVDSEVVS